MPENQQTLPPTLPARRLEQGHVIDYLGCKCVVLRVFHKTDLDLKGNDVTDLELMQLEKAKYGHGTGTLRRDRRPQTETCIVYNRDGCLPVSFG